MATSLIQVNRVAYYRLYSVGRAGEFTGVIDTQLSTDIEAIRWADARVRGGAMELWNRDRLVKRYPRAAEGAAGRSA